MDADIFDYHDRGGEETRLTGTVELLRTRVLLAETARVPGGLAGFPAVARKETA